MEGKRRESEEVDAGTPTKMKMGLGQLDVSKEVNHTQSESLKVYMDNHITLSRVSRMENGLMNALSSENLSMNDLIHSSTEDGFHSSQDTCLNSKVECRVDPLKYTLNTENENAVLEVKMQPCTQYYDDEVLGKYQRLPEETSLEEETCPYLPQLQLHSCNSHAPSSLMTQHRKSVLSFDTTTPNGTVNTNIEIIPVLKPLLTEDANNCVSCDEIKGIINTATMSQQLLGYAGESCNGISTSSLDIALAPDELAEVRDAVVSITANNSEEEAFHNSNNGATSHKLAVSQNAVEGPMCSHRNYSNPQVIICQLKSGTHILCINNADTRELKAIHLLAPKQESEQYLQPDAANSITSAQGQFLPVVSKLNVCTQEQLDNGSIHTYSDSNLQEPMTLTLVGLPCGSWDTKSKKPCNCTKSQCLKLYCDCFANGDICNNCNCNNCYNNPQHDIERFKAIKACLDRNPEAFLPKIGKGKLGDIKPRHNKGCNCKRSGCLKNYCECFEAKIMCSSICKCVGCKNYEGSPDRKILTNVPNHMEIKSDSVSFSDLEILANSRKDRHFSTCISWEVVEATCACLLAQAEEAEKEAFSVCLAEEMILEEFGRCLSQILHSEFKSKGLKVE